MSTRGTDRRVIAMDWLGFGASDKPRKISYCAPLYIDQLKALKTYLGLETFDLVACCVGGSVAMLYANENPESVKTLTVITAATPETTRGGALGSTLSRVGSLKYKTLNALSAHIMKTQLGPKVRREHPEFVAYCRQNYADPSVGHTFSSYNYFTHSLLDSSTPSKNFPPLLVIWGRENPVLSAKKGHKLATRWKATKIEILDKCRYMVMRESPDAVNQSIRDHLEHSTIPSNECAA